MPLAFDPPKAVRRSRRNQELIQHRPTSIAAATRCAVPRSCVHTVVARPESVALASAIASSSVSKGAMWQQGPKISSRMTAALSGRPVQIVGNTKWPSANSPFISGTPPPLTTVAPSAQPLLLVLGGNQRAEVHARLVGWPDLQAFGTGLERGHELLKDRALHVDAL